MDWFDASSWAENLSVDGVTGWRLATTDPALFGVNQTGSELGNLFYNVLGGNAYDSITTVHNANYDLFSNVQSNTYWSATEDTSFTYNAWFFSMNKGYQATTNKPNIDGYAWAVQSGEVPVPAAVWLFGSGLLGLVGIAKRKR